VSRHVGRGRQRTAGQSIAEFALVFPVLIVMLVAIFDFGRLVFAYNDITNAAREGTRVGIIDQTSATIKNEVISQATSLAIAPADVVVTFAKSDDPTKPCGATSTTPPTMLDCLVVVTVSYNWRAITPIVGNIVGPIRVTAVSKMPVERIFP
jgi:Flp pilus assembly protein TadG